MQWRKNDKIELLLAFQPLFYKDTPNSRVLSVFTLALFWIDFEVLL